MLVARCAVTVVISGLTLAAVGCGASRSQSVDTVQIKRVILTAFADIADGNGAGFCALATGAGRAKLASDLPGYTCPQIVALVGEHMSAPLRLGLRHARVRTVSVHGSTATVRDADVTTTQGTLHGFLSAGTSTHLTRQGDGSWKISG